MDAMVDTLRGAKPSLKNTQTGPSMIKYEGKRVGGGDFLPLPLKLQCRARFPVGCDVDVYIHSTVTPKQELGGSEILRGRILDVGIDISPESNRELIYKILRLSISRSDAPTICFACEDSLQFAFGSPVWVASKDKWEKAIIIGSSSHAMAKGQVAVSSFTYYVQLSNGREYHRIRPEVLIYRRSHDQQPEWKEIKPSIVPSPLLIGVLPSNDIDVVSEEDAALAGNAEGQLENNDGPLRSNEGAPGAILTVDTMVTYSPTSGFTQFYLPPQFVTDAFKNAIQSQFWNEGTRVHWSTNQKHEPVAIINYANSEALWNCQMELELILLNATPPPFHGCLLVKLAERNQYRRRCGDIVQSRNPFANTDNGAEKLFFTTLLEQQNYHSLSFPNLPCQEWKRHLEMAYPSCRMEMIDQRADDQHVPFQERPMANIRKFIRPHILVSGPVFNDVYECRMLLESYIESRRSSSSLECNLLMDSRIRKR